MKIEVTGDEFRQGVEMISQKLKKILSDHGVRVMESVGTPFDVEMHDALMQVEKEGVKPGMDGLNGPYARGKTGIELYNLENDISEKNDVADKYPEVVKRLQALGEKAREELGDGKRIGKGVRPPGRLKGSGQK